MVKNNGSAYFFSLPDDQEDYHSVRVIETEMRTEGGVRGVVPESGAVVDVAKANWKQLRSWAPVDSTEYALDPDGSLFMDTAMGDVLAEEGTLVVSKGDGSSKKKKAPRSKVSVR